MPETTAPGAKQNLYARATHLVLSLDKKNIGGFQVNLAALDDKDSGHGRRLLGGKHYNQGTTTVLEANLTADDAREIRAMLDAVFPQEEQHAHNTAPGPADETEVSR